ncbi:MAG: GHKL domain-containing protein, partial [Okeania sp. SIO3B3]|nr:GHKL domain-containing protein [Okeania sp. SIO3B3]
INTPLGIIKSSIESLSDILDDKLEKLGPFLNSLPKDSQDLFFKVIAISTQNQETISTKEKRNYKKMLTSKLEDYNVKDPYKLADLFVDMRIINEMDEISSIFELDNYLTILQMANDISEIKRRTSTISLATDKSSRIVFALKNYAHYDHENELVEADLIEGIETILTLHYNEIKFDVEVIKVYDTISKVLCYPDELNQVWNNIIHNALQAIEYKGIIEINVLNKNDVIQISIIDNGKGIPEEIKDRIFEPFFTTKIRGEGSGLGLDIVQKIITKHQGEIRVDSRPGRTQFTVILPKARGYKKND